jgi:putative transposase
MSEKELDFSEEKLNRWWKEVKDNFWDDMKVQTALLVKYLLEGTLKQEMVGFAGAGWHERSRRRKTYRNGYYSRDLATELGLIRDILVPRSRKKGFRTRVFDRYQRRQEKVNTTIRKMFVAGVSTRRVGEVLQTLLEEKVSAATVSEIAKDLDSCVRSFHRRPLKDKYVYLFLDAVYLGVRGALRSNKRPVLVAYGITEDGQRELIAFRVARSESESQWYPFVNDLYRRGLIGDRLRLIVTDGSSGLRNALELVYPYVKRQRCWAHKLRNVSNSLTRKHQKDCINQARSIYEASCRREAVARFREWSDRWKGICPKAVKCLEKDIDELLSFFDFPGEHRKKIRTTNVIERCFREVRRRTRTMSCFNNVSSCERIVYAVFVHMNERWDSPRARLKGFEGSSLKVA